MSQGHNTVTLVKFETVVPTSRVKLSTTEPLRSPDSAVTMRRISPAKCPRGHTYYTKYQNLLQVPKLKHLLVLNSTEFMPFINVKKCWHLNSYLKSESFSM